MGQEGSHPVFFFLLSPQVGGGAEAGRWGQVQEKVVAGCEHKKGLRGCYLGGCSFEWGVERGDSFKTKILIGLLTVLRRCTLAEA